MLSLSSACIPESIFDELVAHSGEEENEESEESGFEPESPSFLEPASGTLSLPADQRSTLELHTQGVRAGSTTLLLDGKNLGTLPLGNREGEFDGSLLRLYFGGSLTKGVHALNLYNPGDPLGALSAPVAIEVTASGELVPTVELSNTAFASAMELHQDESAVSGVLSWVEAGSQDPELSWIRSDGAGLWIDSPLRHADLPSYVPSLGSWSRLSTQVVPAAGDDDESLRIVWAKDRSGLAVHHAHVEAETGSFTSSPQTWDAIAFRFVGGEAYRLGSPQFIDDFVVLPIHAPRDTEQPMPGDHALLYAHWPASDQQPGELRRLTAPPGSDMSQLGTLVDLRAPSAGDSSLLVSIDGIWTRRVATEASLGVLNLPLAPTRGIDPLPANTAYIAGANGALGSRTTLVSAGENSMIHFEATYANRAESQGIIGVPLPAQAPSGPPAVSSWGGRTVFALPYGEENLHVVVSDGARGRAYSLPHQCEQVALGRPEIVSDITTPGDPPTPIAVACLRAGALFLGELKAAP